MGKAENYGIVYLLVNECMPGLVKIGKASRHDLEKRMKQRGMSSLLLIGS